MGVALAVQLTGRIALVAWMALLVAVWLTFSRWRAARPLRITDDRAEVLEVNKRLPLRVVSVARYGPWWAITLRGYPRQRLFWVERWRLPEEADWRLALLAAGWAPAPSPPP